MKYVFLLNMGGANNLDECAEFLRNMFADPNILRMCAPLRWLVGRLIARTRVSAMRSNYLAIGGKSRLSDIERSLCAKMSTLINASKHSEQDEVIIDFISTYVPPRAKDVLAKYEFKASDEVILLPLYPQFSTTTTRSSLEDFKRFYKGAAPLFVVGEFYQNELYNEILINQAKKHADADVLIISAHSLPVSIIKAGDPYERQINEHFNLLRSALASEFAHIELAYQSKLGPIKWLSPSVAEVLERYKGKRVAVLPLSFCIDCSETDFELAIEYAREHEQTGGLLTVCSCPNDSDEFASFLLELIKVAKPLDFIN